MTLAASGSPTKLLTLTAAAGSGDDATTMLEKLHRAWRILRLRIARELMQNTACRWHPRPSRTRRLCTASGGSAPQGKPKVPAALPYFAVVEKTKAGLPHLHILIRCRDFIPQRWLSQQMAALTGSPICDIRQVKGTRQAVAYVAKYLGKEPARFGSSRAYWYTKNWAPSPEASEPSPALQRSWFSVQPRRWTETVDEIERARPLIVTSIDGWFRFERNPAPYYPTIDRHRRPAVTAKDG